jgi:hypothetical protein
MSLKDDVFLRVETNCIKLKIPMELRNLVHLIVDDAVDFVLREIAVAR